MAVTDANPIAEPWATPAWPADPPAPERARVYYNPSADEVVVRFEVGKSRPAVNVLIGTPEDQYVHVLADERTGEVVGVQVDYLLGWTADRHPAWRALAGPDPPPAVIGAFLAEVADLFARHGVGGIPVEEFAAAIREQGGPPRSK